MISRTIMTTTIALAMLISAPINPLMAAESANSLDMLKWYVAELKMSPEDGNLRVTIIKLGNSLKPRPGLPEEAERRMERGAAYMKESADSEGYQKAISEFQAAVNAAPWLGEAYQSLALAQEKAGLNSDAAQSLKYYLYSESDPKKKKDTKTKIVELEIKAEQSRKALKAGKAAQASTANQTQPAIQASAAQRQEEKPRSNGFEGKWVFRDTGPRGGEFTLHAFTIRKNEQGELIASPPQRSSDSVGTITALQASGKKLKLQIKWTLASVPGYWKTEDYDLLLSDDEARLSGTFTKKSSSSRDFSEDKTLVRE